MPVIDANGCLLEDDWIRIHGEELPHGRLIVPLHTWQSRKEILLARGTAVGVWLAADQHPAEIRDALELLSMVAIDFPSFTDGRGYSGARILRDQYGWRGGLRATGNVLADQLFALRRCGFDSFEIASEAPLEQLSARFADFSRVYQHASADPSPPLLLRDG